MAIGTQVFPVSDFDRKHAPACEFEPRRERVEGRTADDWDWVYPPVEGYCRACAIAEITVTLDGVDYANHSNGTLEKRKGMYTDEQDGYVMSVHHVGLVLESRERNFSDDSDFYAVVWNPETKALDTYEYGTTRFGGTDHNYAQPDLDPKYYDEVRAFYVEREREAIKASLVRGWREQANAAVQPHKGGRLRVVKGRKVPVGFEGVCIWAGESAYGPRFGIKSDEGDVQFVDGRNVEAVVDPDDLPGMEVLTDEQLTAAAEAAVDQGVGRRRWLKQGESAGLVVVA